jgi:alkylhydroperoxidase/carboxymuconolactone decarboxylase family protein YurZ
LEPSTANLTAHIHLLAAFECGDYDQIASAGVDLGRLTSVETVHEVIRLMHLFYGFPRLVRAWNALPKELLPGSEAPFSPGSSEGSAGSQKEKEAEDLGESTFRLIYGKQTSRVLKHLHHLDSMTCSWILGHAYGKVLSRPELAIEIKERLAVLALAATGCWRQWQSHVDNARRLGVSVEVLKRDMTATSWPPDSVKAQALERLP